MLGMSVSGKDSDWSGGKRCASDRHDEKKVKRMLEGSKREINPDASEELGLFFEMQRTISAAYKVLAEH